MVPAAFVQLDELPLTPNGKIDRKALPTHAGDQPTDAFVEPVTDMERQIASTVAGVLGLEEVGLDSNFFDLGADSVAIIRINNQLTEQFGQEIPIVEMFRYPTVGFLSSFLNKDERQNDSVAIAHSRAEKIRQARKRRKSA